MIKKIVLLIFVGIGVGFLIKTLITRAPIKIGIAQWFDNKAFELNVSGFKESLIRSGYNAGENIEYTVKIANGDAKEQKKVLNQFVSEKFDLIYTLTTPGTLIAKSVSDNIPIVFSIVTYPQEAGIINSNKISGTNLVGTRNYIPMSRQFKTFKELHTNTKNIAFVHRKDEPNSRIQFNDFKRIAAKNGVNLIDIAAVDLKDLSLLLDRKLARKIDSIYSACDTLVQSGGGSLVIDFAKKFNVIDFACMKNLVKEGALIGNVADFALIGAMAGEKAAAILNGANPANMATSWPKEDYIIINMKRANELNIVLSPDLIYKASEIIR